MELNSNSKIQLADNVAYRFEHNFNGGIVILINTENDELWFGNNESSELIKQINQKPQTKTIGEIFSEIISEYNVEQHEIVLDSLNTIINDLAEKFFINIL